MKKVWVCCFGLVFLAGPASAENSQWVEWIGEVELSYGSSDNLNLSAFAEEEEDDTLFRLAAAFGRFYQIDGKTRMHIAVTLASEHYNDFDLLDNVSAGLSVGLRHKFGIGLEVPYLQFILAYQDRSFDDEVRDVDIFEASIEVGKNFSERFSLAGNFTVTAKDGVMGPVVPLGPDPNLPSDPFDQDFWTASIFADYILTQNWLLSFEYTRRDGDFDSACSINLPTVFAVEQVKAITFQDAFAGCAYQVDGDADIYSATLSYAISAHSGVDLRLRFYEGSADVLEYSGRSLQLSYNYRY